MSIEIWTVPDCPNEKLFRARLRQALDAAGLRDVAFTTRVVTDQNEAERVGFTGSPTVLIDGHDPFADEGRPAGLACRVYGTPEGGLAGAPSVGQLKEALAASAVRGRP
ncbi:glutaredoxin family protein [Streptomyces sp. NPDC048172]|uniref:glutaredoxin family protein n=1 Tax=Streptomyces sp. NPDC048172 TaxID=3365505 RepID=UPI00371E95E1